MQNNPFINWEYRLRRIWDGALMTDFNAAYDVVTEESKKYKSLYRFVGENEEFDALITTWNTLLDFDIEEWFNRPYNSNEHYIIRTVPSWPQSRIHWGVTISQRDQLLHKGWSGYEQDWYITININITVNQIIISFSDTMEETHGEQFLIRKIGDIPYEIQK